MVPELPFWTICWWFPDITSSCLRFPTIFITSHQLWYKSRTHFHVFSTMLSVPGKTVFHTVNYFTTPHLLGSHRSICTSALFADSQPLCSPPRHFPQTLITITTAMCTTHSIIHSLIDYVLASQRAILQQIRNVLFFSQLCSSLVVGQLLTSLCHAAHLLNHCQ